jgi:hypothetical protein
MGKDKLGELSWGQNHQILYSPSRANRDLPVSACLTCLLVYEMGRKVCFYGPCHYSPGGIAEQISWPILSFFSLSSFAAAPWDGREKRGDRRRLPIRSSAASPAPSTKLDRASIAGNFAGSHSTSSIYYFYLFYK